MSSESFDDSEATRGSGLTSDDETDDGVPMLRRSPREPRSEGGCGDVVKSLAAGSIFATSLVVLMLLSFALVRNLTAITPLAPAPSLAERAMEGRGPTQTRNSLAVRNAQFNDVKARLDKWAGGQPKHLPQATVAAADTAMAGGAQGAAAAAADSAEEAHVEERGRRSKEREQRTAARSTSSGARKNRRAVGEIVVAAQSHNLSKKERWAAALWLEDGATS